MHKRGYNNRWNGLHRLGIYWCTEPINYTPGMNSTELQKLMIMLLAPTSVVQINNTHKRGEVEDENHIHRRDFARLQDHVQGKNQLKPVCARVVHPRYKRLSFLPSRSSV